MADAPVPSLGWTGRLARLVFGMVVGDGRIRIVCVESGPRDNTESWNQLHHLRMRISVIRPPKWFRNRITNTKYTAITCDNNCETTSERDCNHTTDVINFLGVRTFLSVH